MNRPPEILASSSRRELVVGTRGSALALAQTAIVCDALRRANPTIALRVERINTTGDVRSDTPLSQLGRGIFVKEIETALVERRIDVAVHSAKDLQSTLPPNLLLAAFLRREDARDVVVSSHGRLHELPLGARVGTSSPRRACQIRALRPDVQTVDVRGNVDTRLRKLARGDFDALVLAAAGLIRLNRVAEVSEWLDTDTFIPSVGQGALVVELRTDDPWAVECVRPLDDAATRAAVLAERAFLAQLGAGCQAAAGAYARVDSSDEDVLHLVAFVGAPDGSYARESCSGSVTRPQALGDEIARRLLIRGARFLAKPESALREKVVVITRPADRSAELLALLRAHGALPVLCPTISVELLTPMGELDDALWKSAPPRWIAFASVNGVQAVARQLVAGGRPLPREVRLAAVGSATALAVEEHFRRPDFLSSTANADALGAELPDVAGGIVLLPRGDLAAPTLASRLASRGALVRDVVVYQTKAGPGVEELTERARAGAVDAVVFASPSSVEFAAAAIDAFRDSHTATLIVCIGATTARAARAMGLAAVEAGSTSVGGIVETLAQGFEARGADRAAPVFSSGLDV